MEFKGTKGQWKYSVKYRGSCKRALIQVTIPKKYYPTVLELGSIGSDDCNVASCCCTEEHANALLISKSPEMLEMLQEIVSYGGVANFDKIKQLIKEATTLEGDVHND